MQTTELNTNNANRAQIISADASGKPIRIDPSELSVLFCFPDLNDKKMHRDNPVLAASHVHAISDYINKEVITEVHV